MSPEARLLNCQVILYCVNRIYIGKLVSQDGRLLGLEDAQIFPPQGFVTRDITYVQEEMVEAFSELKTK